MANEISASCSLSASKGGADVSSTTSFSQDMAGEDMVDNTQTISTGATLLDLGAITGLPAMIMVQNLDPTNFITLSAESNFNANSTVFAKILPLKANLISPATAIYAKADSANVKICLTAVEA